MLKTSPEKEEKDIWDETYGSIEQIIGGERSFLETNEETKRYILTYRVSF